MTYPATASDRMAWSRGVVDALLDASRAHAARGNDDAVVALVTGAATLSRRRHTGWFTNSLLESQLRAAGERLAASWAPARPPRPGRLPGRSSDSVLHIMTRAYAAGGHTRLVERWIEGDSRAVSSVVLTQATEADVPTSLVRAIERSGGEVHCLRGTAVERTRQLHALAFDSERVMLSIHENDVVPPLALAGLQKRPPVLALNHAEHVYWTGASLADIVVSFRPASSDLAVARRGIPRARCVEVPLPVSTPRRRDTAVEARRALGIEPDHKVLLTVGWGYKFTPYAGDDLITALGPVLDDPDVHLIAVGPHADEEMWSSAQARSNGRVQAVGAQDNVQQYLDAADVLVDSYPIASLTAALEAAIFGLPVVGLAPRDAAWPCVLREDDPALVDAMFDDLDAYRGRIRALLRDPAAWRSASRTQQELVIRRHGPGAWAAAMQRVHEALAGAAGDRRQPRKEDLGTPGAEDTVLATYVADCEDRLIRPELRWKPDHSSIDDVSIGRIDELLLRPASPTSAGYEEALRLARGAMPRRFFARRLRVLRG